MKNDNIQIYSYVANISKTGYKKFHITSRLNNYVVTYVSQTAVILADTKNNPSKIRRFLKDNRHIRCVFVIHNKESNKLNEKEINEVSTYLGNPEYKLFSKLPFKEVIHPF